MTLTIRDATPDDAQVVIENNANLALETEGKTLDSKRLVPGVRAILADPHKGQYFLACDGEEVLGQLAITYEWSDWRNGWFWWFQSVYISKTARRRGIFSALYDHVLQMARQRDDVCGLRLYHAKDNHEAQATYAARGMVGADYQIMEFDFGATEAGMPS